jgi:hypothetical protein
VKALPQTYVRTGDKAPENFNVESIEKSWSTAGLESSYNNLLNPVPAETK